MSCVPDRVSSNRLQMLGAALLSVGRWVWGGGGMSGASLLGDSSPFLGPSSTKSGADI